MPKLVRVTKDIGNFLVSFRQDEWVELVESDFYNDKYTIKQIGNFGFKMSSVPGSYLEEA